ncbi:ribonuclease P protein component [Aestuariimicrobium ganziense]|uniref:ribonuclease P protein component n=1 Tax=Aestuariimicrobium ganziense TaxID=2773677 RepID=UPI0019413D1A|nr:ribonuclease P protein component [Aestuariimicrobium ganziense]
MLASRARLKTSADFRETTRHGVRVARPSMVVHLRATQSPLDEVNPTRVGFVVSKAVGGAVVRNRVKRQLRHLARPLVEAHPTGYDVVVRALPAAVGSSRLDDDLRGAWRGAITRLEARR